MNKNKVIAWVFIMTLLISQSYAYASVPCESNGDINSQQHNDMRTMQNSMTKHVMTSDMQHSMQQQNVQQKNVQQKNMAMDCCDQECSCPTGVFSSAMLTYFFTTSALNLVSKPSNFYLFSIQETFLPSLRKPPIIG